MSENTTSKPCYTWGSLDGLDALIEANNQRAEYASPQARKYLSDRSLGVPSYESVAYTLGLNTKDFAAFVRTLAFASEYGQDVMTSEDIERMRGLLGDIAQSLDVEWI